MQLAPHRCCDQKQNSKLDDAPPVPRQSSTHRSAVSCKIFITPTPYLFLWSICATQCNRAKVSARDPKHKEQ